jgi:hypothetical protein
MGIKRWTPQPAQTLPSPRVSTMPGAIFPSRRSACWCFSRQEASMNYSERPPRAAILTSCPIWTSSVLGWSAQRCSTTFIRDSRPALKSTCLRAEVAKLPISCKTKSRCSCAGPVTSTVARIVRSFLSAGGRKRGGRGTTVRMRIPLRRRFDIAAESLEAGSSDPGHLVSH